MAKLTRRQRVAQIWALRLVAGVLLIAFVFGWFGGGWIFERFHAIPAADELGVRGALGIASVSFTGFFWSLWRIIRSEPPLDMSAAVNISRTLVAMLAAGLGAVVAITVFR